MEPASESWNVLMNGNFMWYPQSSNAVYHVVLVENQGLYYQKVKLPAPVDHGNNYMVDSRGPAEPSTYDSYECLEAKDIVGCQCMRDPLPPSQQTTTVPNSQVDNTVDVVPVAAYFCVYSYPIRKQSFGKSLKRRRVSLTFTVDQHETFRENLIVAERWKDAIRCMLHGAVSIPIRPADESSVEDENSTRIFSNGSSASVQKIPCQLCQHGRKLLIFVNPASGPGKALKIFQERVVPVLAEAGISYDVVVTDKAKGAEEHVKTVNLNQFHGIVIVSGDGLVFEVINGLMGRPDWASAVRIPLGIVPGGSGNALAKAISHASREPLKTNPKLLAAFNIAKGKVAPMDVIRVVTSKSTMYSFLSVGWGIIADIDIESERLRALGESRFTLWAIARILDLRVYRGRLWYLPAERASSENCRTTNTFPRVHESHPVLGTADHDSNVDEHACHGLPPSASCPALTRENGEGFPKNPVYIVPSEDVKCGGDPSSDEKLTDEQPSLLPPLNDPVPETWVYTEDDFVLVYFVFQSHISSSAMVAPLALPDDGLMWMIIIRKGATRRQLINFLLAIDSGSHINLPFVEMRPVHAFRLEPMTQGRNLTVDGEVVDYGPIQAEVLHGIARIMTH